MVVSIVFRITIKYNYRDDKKHWLVKRFELVSEQRGGSIKFIPGAANDKLHVRACCSKTVCLGSPRHREVIECAPLIEMK